MFIWVWGRGKDIAIHSWVREESGKAPPMPRGGLGIAPWKHVQPVTLALPKAGNPGGT